MRVPGRKLLVRAFRWGRSRFGHGILVLGYHRLGETRDDPLGLSVSPSDFSEHLEVIAARARTMTLAAAARALVSDTLPRRGVVVTFDDGYADLLTEVLPRLERTGTPATMFVTTGPRGEQFWWDELAGVFRGAPALPARLELELRGTRRSWTFRADRHGRSAKRDTAVYGHALRELADELRMLDAPARRDVLNRLHEWSGRSPAPPAHRSLAPAEVATLSRNPLVEVGAHTVSHPVLPRLAEAEQHREVLLSRAELEDVIGRQVCSFSYPHGAYSASTVAAVRRAGFTAACGSTPDVISRRSDILALPRMWIHPREPARFERWLDRWLLA